MAHIEHVVVREVTEIGRDHAVDDEEENDEVDFGHQHCLSNLTEVTFEFLLEAVLY